ncbi:hypothetical protein GGS23DRAFT_613361 [Durotheca rogersii]|uniref:uncharacterized protein n=1 Tax=Durotheca rogersii TaxID=419775 RepID=UPI0022211E52|nr:uncharacterized protein GGS23DRAFT_613361 [Durotheca rogersii]KAI5860829.1 hypothetical protein GGS23DRAFT_613361 [Durotheca rogersii]
MIFGNAIAFPAALVLLLARQAAARTDYRGCVSSRTVVFGGASLIWYLPDTGEICENLDCGGGRAPPRTDVPGCDLYSGTATYSPRYLPGFGPNATPTSTAASPTSTDSDAATGPITTAPTVTTSATVESGAGPDSESSGSPSDSPSSSPTPSGSQGPETVADLASTTAPVQGAAAMPTAGALGMMAGIAAGVKDNPPLSSGKLQQEGSLLRLSTAKSNSYTG